MNKQADQDEFNAAQQSQRDFDDPLREWRRLFAEAWGTFLLVLVAAGAHMVGVISGEVSHVAQVVAPGMMVMAIIYFMGSVGGAHLNPAVTLAFAARRNFPWHRFPAYVVAQAVGALAAVFLLRSLLGEVGELGATTPQHRVSDRVALAIEIVLTAGLVNVILGTASGARNVGANGAIAIGAYIALAGLWAEPISGASMNPMRSLAPDVLRGDFSTTWIYLVGPLIGALIGVAFEWILKGPPTAEGSKAAQGTAGERKQ